MLGCISSGFLLDSFHSRAFIDDDGSTISTISEMPPYLVCVVSDSAFCLLTLIPCISLRVSCALCDHGSWTNPSQSATGGGRCRCSCSRGRWSRCGRSGSWDRSCCSCCGARVEEASQGRPVCVGEVLRRMLLHIRHDDRLRLRPLHLPVLPVRCTYCM